MFFHINKSLEVLNFFVCYVFNNVLSFDRLLQLPAAIVRSLCLVRSEAHHPWWLGLWYVDGDARSNPSLVGLANLLHQYVCQVHGKHQRFSTFLREQLLSVWLLYCKSVRRKWKYSTEQKESSTSVQGITTFLCGLRLNLKICNRDEMIFRQQDSSNLLLMCKRRCSKMQFLECRWSTKPTLVKILGTFHYCFI